MPEYVHGGDVYSFAARFGGAPVERISLVPYAQAPLRVAQFPWARNR